MKLLFIDNITWDYNIESVYQRPLGGSQSAFTYLAEALARRGHQICYATNTSQPGTYRGVQCVAIGTITQDFLRSFAPDGSIVLNGGISPQALRHYAGSHLFICLWNQHAPNQPQIQLLADPATRQAFNYVGFVSEWQRSVTIPYFSLQPEKTVVFRNAIAPAFEGLFSSAEDQFTCKSDPPTLVYTSTPFRGLDVLVKVFPEIRKAVPNVRLKVFSSMKVYHASDDVDAQQYGALYQACRATPGIEYIGSVPQHQLAQELRHANALAYPNTFAETSCISVMEAMAAGCGIISSDLGALTDTTAGFGRLISQEQGMPHYIEEFRDATIQFLERSINTRDEELAANLRAQVEYVNSNYTWSKRAEEWEFWLTNQIRKSIQPS